MAQIHALTPEGRLPTAAVEHVQELVGASSGVTSIDIPTTADWQTGVQTEVKAYRSGNVVTVSAWRLAVNSGVTGDVIAYSLPTGYRTPPLTNIYGLKDSRGATVNASSDTVRVLNPSGSVAHHSFTFVTLDPPPTA